MFVNYDQHHLWLTDQGKRERFFRVTGSELEGKGSSIEDVVHLDKIKWARVD